MPDKSAKRSASRKKFNKLAELNSAIDDGVQGASKAKKMMSDTWNKRCLTNAGGYFKQSKAKAAPCYITKG